MKNRIDSLQGIRAFAFLGIYTCHSYLTVFGACGGWGVSVFMILSGFLMFYSYADTDRIKSIGLISNIKFGIGKVKRLYPLHIVTMLLAMPFLIEECLGYHGIERILQPAVRTLLNTTLLQTWVPVEGVYFSLNTVSWYLSTSLFLYCMFPVILFIMKKYKGIKTAVIVILCTFALQCAFAYLAHRVQMDVLHKEDFTHWFTYVFPLSRLEDFVIGCNLGYIFMHAKRRDDQQTEVKYTVLEIGILIVIVLQWVAHYFLLSLPSQENPQLPNEAWWRFTVYWTLTSCALVYIFAVNKGKLSKLFSTKPLLFIGKMSAYAFLIHQLVYRYLKLAEKKILGKPNDVLNLFICFIITIILSVLWDKLTLHFQKRKQLKRLAGE